MRDATRTHLADLRHALSVLEEDAATLERWGEVLAVRLGSGARLLAAGNGGSAAQAQHLTAELVGRYVAERPPMSAIPLTADTASLTAIANDYGGDEALARQVCAHGRAGDVLVALSTSGRSPNVLAAAAAAHACGLVVWGLTGRGPNPLAAAADECVCIDAAATATVQEAHMVALHLLCAAVDHALGAGRPLAVGGAV
jgi:D-sedoheptulose 7-phosphate isomerase